MGMKRERMKDNPAGLCRLSIDGDMTIYAIESLKLAISEEIDVYDSFELGLGDVEEIDSSGIQLLLAFKKELVRQEKILKIISMSSVVEKLLMNYGIYDTFDMGNPV